MEVNAQKENESKEVKGASPESDTKPRESQSLCAKADPVRLWEQAKAASTQETSATRRTGVADSIELLNGREVTQASDESKALGESTAKEVPEYRSRTQGRPRDGSVAAMGTGKPQRLAEKA